MSTKQILKISLCVVFNYKIPERGNKQVGGGVKIFQHNKQSAYIGNTCILKQ